MHALTRRLYALALLVVAPAALLWLWWRGRREPAYREHLGERLSSRGFAPGGVWIHAASAGEVQIAAGIVATLRAQYPELPLTLTTNTPVGRARAIDTLGEQVHVRYAPLDLPWLVERICAHSSPRAVVLVELELWPALLDRCRARSIPVISANARISARSARRLRRARWLFERSLRDGVTVGAQSTSDADRFVALGVPPASVRVTGNLKLDFDPPLDLATRAAEFRAALGVRPVWVAGSTHRAEHAILLRAHALVLETIPDALLVIAPRRLDHVAEVQEQLGRMGIPALRRLEGRAVPPAASVLVLDTFGELLSAYASAHAAFVGGSLRRDGGGHNLVEPIALGVPVITGPYHEGARGVLSMLRAERAVAIAKNEHQIAATLLEWYRNRQERARVVARAARVVISNRGARLRTLELIEAALAPSRTDADLRAAADSHRVPTST